MTTTATSSPRATLAPITSADLPEVARIHMLAFPDGATTALGLEATRRYYAWLLSPVHDATCMGAHAGGKLVGFLFAGRFDGALSGFLQRNRAYLAFRLATHPWLVASPIVRDRLVMAAKSMARTLRGPATPAAAAAAPPPPRKSYGILAIAVDPTVQGTGAGRVLMDHAERMARERHFPEMHLTVHPENTHAVGFYEHLGWRRHPAADGVFRGSMKKPLAAEARPS